MWEQKNRPNCSICTWALKNPPNIAAHCCTERSKHSYCWDQPRTNYWLNLSFVASTSSASLSTSPVHAREPCPMYVPIHPWEGKQKPGIPASECQESLCLLQNSLRSFQFYLFPCSLLYSLQNKPTSKLNVAVTQHLPAIPFSMLQLFVYASSDYSN